jgi:hypothetical protein
METTYKKKVLLLFLHERHREAFLDNVLPSAFTTLYLNERKAKRDREKELRENGGGGMNKKQKRREKIFC